ncbi:MAG: glycosyltransferase family 39 protein, partial [Candidatus Eisenbacteria bacterium]
MFSPTLSKRLLIAILALALAARLWGIRYGLPWLFYFHDEPQVVLRALRFGTGDLDPHFFIWPATPLLYLAFLSYVSLFAFGRVTGLWSGKSGFAAAYFRDPSIFYILPRLHSVAFGVWGVWLANGAVTAAYGTPVGIATALGLAVNALHAHYSHFAHPVTAMTAFTLLGLWAAVRLAQDGGRRELTLGAVAIGVGTSCQYHAALLVVPLGVAVLLRAAREPGHASTWLVRGLVMGLAGVGLFLLIAPYTLLDYATFRADLAWITAKTSGTATGPPPGALAGLDTYVRACLVPGLGAPLAIAAALGALLALVRRTR